MGPNGRLLEGWVHMYMGLGRGVVPNCVRVCVFIIHFGLEVRRTH